MDPENSSLIKIKPNSFSIKDDRTDALETPQIRNFRHENDLNIFSDSFRNENLKNLSGKELSRVNSADLAESPLTAEFSASIIDPSEIQQPPPPQQPVVFSVNVAPKKKFLERTISQTDAEQQKQNDRSTVQEFIFARQDLPDKNLKRPSSKQAEPDDTSPKPSKVLQQLPPVTHSSDTITNHLNKKPINKPHNENSSNNKKSTIENILNFQQPSNNKISSLIMQQHHQQRQQQSKDTLVKSINSTNNHYNNNSNHAHAHNESNLQSSEGKKAKQNDFVTSSVPDADKKTKSKRSIMMNSDVRKQQIRNSNREAARRCRERRSNYIKTLENKITVLETKQKVLLTDNSSLLKQVHELKQMIDGNVTGYSSAASNNHNNFHNQSNANNFSALFANQQLKSVPVLLTLEIPNGSGIGSSSSAAATNLNNSSATSTLQSNMRQLTNVLNGNSSLINSPEMLKQVVDAIQYGTGGSSVSSSSINSSSRPSSAQTIIDGQSHLHHQHHHHNHNNHHHHQQHQQCGSLFQASSGFGFIQLHHSSFFLLEFL